MQKAYEFSHEAASAVSNNDGSGRQRQDLQFSGGPAAGRAAGSCSNGAESQSRECAGPRPSPVDVHQRDSSAVSPRQTARNRGSVPSVVSPKPDHSSVQPSVQCLGSAAMSGFAPSNQVSIPQSTNSHFPLSLPQYHHQNQANGLPAPHFFGRYRRSGQIR